MCGWWFGGGGEKVRKDWCRRRGRRQRRVMSGEGIKTLKYGEEVKRGKDEGGRK